MLTLPDALIQKSNQLGDSDAWLWLLEVQLASGTVRYVLNTEDIIWNGREWYKCYFIISEITEDDKASQPNLTIQIPNVDQTIQNAVENINGGVGATVILRLVHSGNLTEISVPSYTFQITGASLDGEWANFTLGASTVYNKRVPQRRLIKNYCAFRFKGELCGYTGTATSCDKTLARCRELGNSSRFGGFPGVGTGRGFYA
jgi:lambda family phage minor tail protein L